MKSKNNPDSFGYWLNEQVKSIVTRTICRLDNWQTNSSRNHFASVGLSFYILYFSSSSRSLIKLEVATMFGLLLSQPFFCSMSLVKRLIISCVYTYLCLLLGSSYPYQPAFIVAPFQLLLLLFHYFLVPLIVYQHSLSYMKLYWYHFVGNSR